MKILTSQKDDFLYEYLINLLKQVKLVRGGTELAYTLRRHRKIADYLKEKQKNRLYKVEEDFFNPDGTLDQDAIDGHFESSQTNQNIVY